MWDNETSSYLMKMIFVSRLYNHFVSPGIKMDRTFKIYTFFRGKENDIDP